MTKENIREKGQAIFLSEAQTLKKIAESLDERFSQAVEWCQQASGRIIITGIGKNQHIGQKISSTLNSTGTPSLFMHAADAIHGDLGMIQKGDLILCLSKSGNSPEIKVLIPLIRSLGNRIIGITAEEGSFLSLQADLCLTLPVKDDACPHQLTPTNSTTAFLVFGDALAICLLEINQFTSGDFARLHPGGSLGKKLYLKVSDLYPLNEKPLVFLNTSLNQSILEISAKRLGATAVLNSDHQLEGIITDGDLRRLLEKNQNLDEVTARDVMSTHPRTIHPDAYAVEALGLMRTNNITQLLVVKEQNYLGVIHIHDILKEGIV